MSNVTAAGYVRAGGLSPIHAGDANLDYPVLRAGAIGAAGVRGGATWKQLKHNTDTRMHSWLRLIMEAKGTEGTDAEVTYWPYSKKRKRQDLANVEQVALTNLTRNPQTPTKEVMDVFRSVRKGKENRGMTLQDCRDKHESILSEIQNLEEQRNQYVQLKLVNNEKMPKLNNAARQQLDESEVLDAIARSIALGYEMASEAPNAAEAKQILDDAANAVALSYGLEVRAALGGGYTIRTSDGGRMTEMQARVRRLILEVYRQTDAATRPAGGRRRVVSAQEAADRVHKWAIAKARNADRRTAQLTMFNSPVLDGYAKEIRRLKRELEFLGDNVLVSLSNAPDKSVYDDPGAFNGYYKSVFDTYNEIAGESLNRLNELGIQIGFPSIVKERREASTRRQIKTQLREVKSNLPAAAKLSLVETIGLAGLWALSGGGGGTAAFLAGLGGLMAVNTAAIAWWGNDDYD